MWNAPSIKFEEPQTFLARGGGWIREPALSYDRTKLPAMALASRLPGVLPHYTRLAIALGFFTSAAALAYRRRLRKRKNGSTGMQRITSFAVIESPSEKAAMANHITRASMDIGSGQHKLVIAVVDRELNSIVRILHAEQKQVLLNHALVQSSDGRLNDEVLGASFTVLRGFRDRALSFGATQFAGVCTAVFRRAANGEAFLKNVNQTLGLGLRVVSQRIEGELGFLAATSGLPPSASCVNLLSDNAGNAPLAPMIAWDSGGGSFQACRCAFDCL